jgi:hypothetical protein
MPCPRGVGWVVGDRLLRWDLACHKTPEWFWKKTANRAPSRNRCNSGKPISVEYSECVSVALGIQHAMRTRRIDLRPVWLYHISAHYLIKRTSCGGKTKLLNLKYILIVSTNFVWNVYHSKEKWARYDHKCTYIGLHVKCPLCLSELDETWIFKTDSRKNSQFLNFMKICPGDVELFYADRQAWRN